MVAVGPEYEILVADVGMNGIMSDGGNWSRNAFRMKLVLYLAEVHCNRK